MGATMLELSSPVFSAGGPIPRAHTCDGADLSLPLAWKGVPDGTTELALIMDDPDAPGGTFVHWVLYGLVPTVTGLPSGMPGEREPTRPVAARQGMNGFRTVGYRGPCPPKGPAHRYDLRLYALDAALTVPPGATDAVLRAAMQGHLLDTAELMGTYGR